MIYSRLNDFLKRKERKCLSVFSCLQRSRITALPSGVLQIYGVQQKDAGNYRCVATTVANRRKSAEGTLTVLPGSQEMPSWTQAFSSGPGLVSRWPEFPHKAYPYLPLLSRSGCLSVRLPSSAGSFNLLLTYLCFLKPPARSFSTSHPSLLLPRTSLLLSTKLSSSNVLPPGTQSPSFPGVV